MAGGNGGEIERRCRVVEVTGGSGVCVGVNEDDDGVDDDAEVTRSLTKIEVDSYAGKLIMNCSLMYETPKCSSTFWK